MPAVKILCDKVDKVFFEVLANSATAATYLLANLYRYLLKAQGDDKDRIKITLQKLHKQCRAQDINVLWQALLAKTDLDWPLLSQDIQSSLTLLKKNFLRKKFYLKQLSKVDLLQIGKDVKWYREIFIALIRQHLWANNLKDPFVYPEFSFQLVSQGAAEQNFLYVSNFVAKCSSLPTECIVQLGIDHPQVAQLLLKDLINSSSYFQIGAQFAKWHPSLREGIAKSWQYQLETYPLNQTDQTFLQQSLPQLKKSYPEFRDAKLDSRVTRHFQLVVPSGAQLIKKNPPRCMFVLQLPAPITVMLSMFRRLNHNILPDNAKPFTLSRLSWW